MYGYMESMLSSLVKKFSRRDFEIFFLFFPEKKKIWHFMQIVSLEDNLYEMSNPIFLKKKKKKKKEKEKHYQFVVC